MAHKFRIQFGKNKFKNLPDGSEYCRTSIHPLGRLAFLPFGVRFYAFQFIRGTVGGALLFDSFSITFPLPRKQPKRKYDIRDE